MRSVLALMRAAFLSATSYRLATLISFAGLLVSVVPLWFVANALQPVVAGSIADEGGQYFGFLIVGIAATYVLMAAATAIPTAIASGLGGGTLESLLVTRTPLPLLLTGMAAYPVALALVRALVLLLGARVAGVDVAWRMLPAALAILAVMIVAYAAIGLVAAALILAFRTAGPLLTAVIAGSGLLGGVYYSTTVIPSWLRDLSGAVPLTYALRAMRQLLLGGAGTRDVVNDASALVLLTVVLLAAGLAAFSLAMRAARRRGTLSLY